ncbi:histidine kinase [Streptomyces sp. SID5476]|uniref:Two-component system sensor kinase n=1 Tax=Streptomyces bottropensis ATCC 25435 TaxID=1054862 RepID=M3FFT6_9ACTN|nr:two-component system sensor kinase [Streptomyces bottropensis ATCC 25435]MZD22194.1 histidine kinase [Streptomyces sp. SID5476]
MGGSRSADPGREPHRRPRAGPLREPRRAALGALLVPPGVLAYFAPKEDPAVVPVAVVEGRLPDGGHVGAALTNALRHGHARSAEVTARRQRWGNTVLVRVVDGRGLTPRYRPGRGLRGIGERAAAHGGSMAHGPVGDGGGFALSVELPLPSPPVPPPGRPCECSWPTTTPCCVPAWP